MKSVNIIPEKGRSKLDELVEGIDQDPAFQHVVGAPKRNDGRDSNEKKGVHPSGRLVILHNTRLQPFKDLGKRMRDIEKYFQLGMDRDDARAVCEFKGKSVTVVTNTLFAVLQMASGNEGIARMYLRGAEELKLLDQTSQYCVATNGDGVVDVMGTAGLCLAYAVFGERFNAEKCYAGLRSMCVWDTVKAGGRVVHTGEGEVRPVENALAALATDAVNANYQEIIQGMRNYFSFEPDGDKVSVWRRTSGESTFFGAEHMLTMALCFKVLVGHPGGLWKKAEQDLMKEQELGSRTIMFDGGGQTNSFLNVMYLLNRMAGVENALLGLALMAREATKKNE